MICLCWFMMTRAWKVLKSCREDDTEVREEVMLYPCASELVNVMRIKVSPLLGREKKYN